MDGLMMDIRRLARGEGAVNDMSPPDSTNEEIEEVDIREL